MADHPAAVMDEVVTHAEVMRWLPAPIRRELELTMPPEQPGSGPPRVFPPARESEYSLSYWWFAAYVAVLIGLVVWLITRLL